MKAWLLLLLAGPWLLGAAPLTILPDESPPVLFADQAESVEARFLNPTATNVEVSLRFRLLQAGTATVMPISEVRSWKKLPVLAGQTVVERLAVRLPAVRAETRFLVQWLDEGGQAIGTSDLVAVPPDLLTELKALAGDRPLGVFDPTDQLKPLLPKVGVEFEDLDLEGLERFRGRLAIVCPADPTQVEPSALLRRLTKCRGAGVNLLWFRNVVPAPAQPVPVCLRRPGGGTLVLADARGLVGLSGRPDRQRALICLARLAVNAEPSELTQP